ncbi:MAG TPA: hypothetical protein VFV50_13745 [Bdellovibrionales bacterium]|nr:hypothetical protein [Bdellovibrionales bacterium]
MENSRLYGALAILVFFVAASAAWRASWQSAKTNPPLTIEKTLDEEWSPSRNTVSAPLFKAPAKSKDSAPKWGSFQVAGLAPAIPVSLKTHFNNGVKPTQTPKPSTNKAAEAKKKKDEKKKQVAKKDTKPATTASNEKKSKASDDKGMKPIEDNGPVGGTVVVQNPVTPKEEPVKKKTAATRTAQEWELYLTESASTVKARTTEFINAYQGGQLANEEDGSQTPAWIYPLIQKMFDDNETPVQEQGIRIAGEVHTSGSFAVMVQNDDRIDQSLRTRLRTAYMSYQDISKVRHLKMAMFHFDSRVQNQALDNIDGSVTRYLSGASQQQAPVNQRPPAASQDPRELFSTFLPELDTLTQSDKDPEVVSKAAFVSNKIKQSLGANGPGQLANNNPAQ